jgi:hypothetical protein
MQTAKEKNEITLRLLAQAPRNLESQKLTLAFQNATDALQAQPDDPELRVWSR